METSTSSVAHSENNDESSTLDSLRQAQVILSFILSDLSSCLDNTIREVDCTLYYVLIIDICFFIISILEINYYSLEINSYCTFWLHLVVEIVF